MAKSVLHFGAGFTVVLVAGVRWHGHPHLDQADFLVLAILYVDVYSLLSGTFGPGLVQWSRNDATFMLLKPADDPLAYYVNYGLTLLVFAAVLFFFFQIQQ